MARLALVSLAVSFLLVAPGHAIGAARIFRLVAPDGVVHLTNTPGDPRYRRMSGMSGTSAGWLHLAGVEASRYAAEIGESATRYGVPRRLVEAVIRAESAFNAWAVSRTGARGLMQLMPTTASMLGVRDAFNPRENIDGGVRHLRGLMDRYANNLRLALAAYNAGEQAVSGYRGVPPYPETQRYVEKILGEYGEESASPPRDFYTHEKEDGTVTYSNIPPGQRRGR